MRYPSSPIPWRDPRPPYRPRRAAVSNVFSNPAVWLGLLVIASLVLLAGALVAVQLLGLIAPGVQVGDVRLDWKTRAQAARLLDAEWNQKRELLLSDGDRSWASTPGFIGLWLDPTATADMAYAVGRSGSAAASPLAAVRGMLRGESLVVPPVARVDAAFAHAQLQQWSALINQPARDAALEIVDGKLSATPALDGANLDIDATLTTLLSDPAGILERGTFTVSMRPISPRVRDVSAAMQQAQALLDHPVSAAAYDPVLDEHLTWIIPPEVVAGWLRVETSPEGTLAVLDGGAALAYLPAYEAQLGAGRALAGLPEQEVVTAALQSGSPIPLRVRHVPTEYVIQPGDTLLRIGWNVGIPYWRIVQSNPGLDAERLTPGKVLTIPSKDDLLPLPVPPGKRIIISIAQQRMWVKQDGDTLREFPISTGIDRSPTQPGIFQVQSHDLSAYASVWDLTMPHFLGIYEAWPGFFNGIHGLPTLSNGTRLWGSILGRPASYGCIILDLASAEWLYGWAEDGVVVEILE